MDRLKELWKHKTKIPKWLIWAIKYKLEGKRTALVSERAYWEAELEKYGELGLHPMLTLDFLPALLQAQKEFNEKIRVLEVGPGPVSRLIEGWMKGLFDLVGVDPLAREYKKMGSKEILVNGNAEEMTKIFPKEFFHMAYASNSLDHVQNPALAFMNMISLAKKNGLIIVCGNIREGTRARWTGLHKHDLWLDRDKLMWETKGKVVCLSDKPTIRVVREIVDKSNPAVPWFSITFQKLV